MLIIKEIQYKLAQRACAKDLSRIIDLTEGHKAAGIPTGHAYYSNLMGQVHKAIATLNEAAAKAEQPTPDINTIAVSFPMLKVLENMCNGTETKSSPFGIALMVFIGGMVITTVLAMYYDWYMLLTHHGAR